MATKSMKILDHMWNDIRPIYGMDCDEVIYSELDADTDYYYLEVRKNTKVIYKEKLLKATVDLAAGV